MIDEYRDRTQMQALQSLELIPTFRLPVLVQDLLSLPRISPATGSRYSNGNFQPQSNGADLYREDPRQDHPESHRSGRYPPSPFSFSISHRHELERSSLLTNIIPPGQGTTVPCHTVFLPPPMDLFPLVRRLPIPPLATRTVVLHLPPLPNTLMKVFYSPHDKTLPRRSFDTPKSPEVSSQ
jgi:hypothetical protein